MKLMKLAAALAFGVLAVATAAQAEDKATIGISMPTKSSARWIADGDNMVKVLQAKGYKTDLQYADDDIPNQLAQIENMITKRIEGPGDRGDRRHDAVGRAAEGGRRGHQGHRLRPPDRRLAERRLLRHLRQLPGRRAAGQARIVDRPRSRSRARGPFNIELFGGSPDDNNAFFFYDGAMSVLQALHRQRQAGRAQSKQMGMDKVGTLRWDGGVAQARMDNLLSAYYTKKQGRRRAVAL